MGIQESTIKRLWGLARNKCTLPDCHAPLVIGDVVVGEIGHIHSRRKGGPRHNPNLTLAERDKFENLLLLCRTCHKLIDAQPTAYDADWLRSIKAAHERNAPLPLDLSVADARYALLILANHNATRKKTKNRADNVTVSGGVQSTATYGGVAVSIGGVNQAPINIRMPASKSSGSKYPANSIGADANMSNYVDYLCDLYVRYMASIEPDEGRCRGRIGKQIKDKFRLRKRTRNHLSVGRFWDLVNFIIEEKLAKTTVGRMHLSRGTKLCRTFDEYRHSPM